MPIAFASGCPAASVPMKFPSIRLCRGRQELDRLAAVEPDDVGGGGGRPADRVLRCRRRSRRPSALPRSSPAASVPMKFPSTRLPAADPPLRSTPAPGASVEADDVGGGGGRPADRVARRRRSDADAVARPRRRPRGPGPSVVACDQVAAFASMWMPAAAETGDVQPLDRAAAEPPPSARPSMTPLRPSSSTSGVPL